MKKIKKLETKQIQEIRDFKGERGRSGKEVMRALAILLVEKETDPDVIKEITDFEKKYAVNLLRKYRKNGVDGLKDKEGKKPRALLTRGQRNEVVKTLKMATPRSFGIDEDYWNTAILGRLIKEQYGVHYKSRTSVTLLFKEARFTYHKPDKQYKARNQERIDQWLKEKAPMIREACNDPNTVVLVADEMMLTTKTTTQKIWLPKGEFPKIDVSSKRQLRCIYGALNVNTGRQHAFKAAGANSTETRSFLEYLGKAYKGYKILLIWDNAIYHKSGIIKDFLSTTKHNFYLINFPPYAPELNPQEHVWKFGRSRVTHNTFIDNIDKATDVFIGLLNETIFDYKFV